MTQEDKESLRELMTSDIWPAVVRMCETLTRKQADALLRYNLEQGEQGLLILKARLDGAEGLLEGIRRAKRELLKEQKDA